MKQLILTFFAAILCYSLFFDKEEKPAAVDEINYIHEDAPSFMNTMRDALAFHVGFFDYSQRNFRNIYDPEFQNIYHIPELQIPFK